MKFNPEKEFFLIESTDLSSVKSTFYGYAVTENGIIRKDEISDSERAALCGCGCYVDVHVANGKISINRDADGCYGLFVYRGENGYFALSNSFYWLLQNIKAKHPVTFNRDYANMFLALNMRSYGWSETPINEISLINRGRSLVITIATARIDERLTFTGECAMEIDSAEGMQNLDLWYEKWMRIYRHLYAETKDITVGLSGGMDSRLSFMMAMKSGMNLNRVSVYSAVGVPDKWGKDTFSEDYSIASQIAQHFGFVLNQHLDRNSEVDEYDPDDVLMIERCIKSAFHKEPYYPCGRLRAVHYSLPGSGGECLRPYYKMTYGQFIRHQESLAALRLRINPNRACEDSIRRIIQHGCEQILRRHGVQCKDDESFSIWYYRDVLDAFHTGRSILEHYFTNTITLMPQHDPLVMRMKWHDKECSDNNLLISVIFTRYCPELLDFKFDSGRVIAPATIEHARQLNAKFPWRGTNSSVGGQPTAQTEKTDEPNEQDGEPISSRDWDKVAAIDERCRKEFLSRSFRRRAIQTLGAEAYYYALFRLKTDRFRSMSECYAVLDLMRVADLIAECAQTPEKASVVHPRSSWGGGICPICCAHDHEKTALSENAPIYREAC